MAKRKLREIYIDIIQQDIKTIHRTETLMFYYIKDNNINNWNLQMCGSIDTSDLDNVNLTIADMLYRYYGNEYSYEVDRDIYYGDCECCGSYEDITTTIYYNDKRLSDIKYFIDGHLGQCSGLTDEEIVEMWNKNNVHITFKYIHGGNND